MALDLSVPFEGGNLTVECIDSMHLKCMASGFDANSDVTWSLSRARTPWPAGKISI
uniref:Ig-like domain-containing protein n=1 Tax=Physcomitrium patens TaxID=3218 RepID=A0A2K1K4L4_PHYPA|nr:hypothetical protein PHYPA_013185 [Physcomitrium patens]